MSTAGILERLAANKPGLFDGSYKTGIANGADEVRAAVRYMVKQGADVIKTCATGGVLSEGMLTKPATHLGQRSLVWRVPHVGHAFGPAASGIGETPGWLSDVAPATSSDDRSS